MVDTGGEGETKSDLYILLTRSVILKHFCLRSPLYLLFNNLNPIIPILGLTFTNIADLQAHNVSQFNVLWAFRSAIFGECYPQNRDAKVQVIKYQV